MSVVTLKSADYFCSERHTVAVEDRHPQYPFVDHTHEFEELVIVWRGNGMHIWNGEPYRITCGDIFYINADDRHSYVSVDHLTMDNILYHRDKFSISADWQQLLPNGKATGPRYWRVGTLGLEQLRESVKTLSQECNKNDPLAIELSEALFLQLALLTRRYRFAPDASTAPQPYQLDVLLVALRAGIAETFNFESFCEEHHFSPRRLRALFKEYTGMTVGNYLRQLRLCKAMALLQTTDQSVSDIATACGFDDSNYFSSVFSRSLGEPPRAFRQRHQQIPTPRLTQ